MPAPEHLISILDQLGDGGTVAMAERVHAIVEQARAGAIPTDVAALEQQISTTKAHFQRRCDALTERAQRAEAEAERFRGEVDSACQTVAQMHAAAVGEVRGPIRGVVEDVQDVRTAWMLAEQRVLDLESLPCVRDAYRAWLDEHGAERAPTIHDLIEASSLGEPDAVAARASVPLEVGQAIAARAMGRDEPDRPEDHDPDDDAPWEPFAVGDPQECTTCDQPLDSPPCILTPDGKGGHTHSAGVEAASGDDIDWGDELAQPAAEPPPAPTNAEIRAWCREHGVSVSSVGVINKAARRAYDDAHQGA